LPVISYEGGRDKTLRRYDDYTYNKTGRDKVVSVMRGARTLWREICTVVLLLYVETNMLSGQTRAVLERKARAGVDAQILLREKRMGDLAWQMTVATQKLMSCPREKRQAKDRLSKLYDEAKAEYDRLKLEVEIESAAEDFGVYLG